MQATRVFFVTLDDSDHAKLRSCLATPEEIENGFEFEGSYISRWMICDSWQSGRERLQFVIQESGS